MKNQSKDNYGQGNRDFQKQENFTDFEEVDLDKNPTNQNGDDINDDDFLEDPENQDDLEDPGFYEDEDDSEDNEIERSDKNSKLENASNFLNRDL